MTPQEKARELVKKFFADEGCISFPAAQRLSTLCVDEILGTIPSTEVTHGIVPLKTPNAKYVYWQSVKIEIEKLL